MRASGFEDTFNCLALPDVALEAGGKWQELRLGFALCPVLIAEHWSGTVGFACFKGHFGSRLGRVSGCADCRRWQMQ